MGTLKKMLGAVVKPVLRELVVESTRLITPSFRVVVLRGDGLKGRGVTPGDKVQVLIDGDFRTYSPYGFDAAAGRMSLLLYLHGDAPGAAWGRNVREGDVVHVFGPRGSIDLTSLTDPVLLVGDETSIGVARSLRDTGSRFAAVLEVTSDEDARRATHALDLPEIEMVRRESDNLHYAALEERVRQLLEQHASSTLVLTGSGPTIVALRAALRARPVPHIAQRTKAYWVPGKRGLD
jgi:NADPH-dependent ferric siderophore reductase